MPDFQKTDLVELAHALGGHPSRLAIGTEGSCAAKISERSYLVTPRGAQLANLPPANLIELDQVRMSELMALESVSDEQIAVAQIHPVPIPVESSGFESSLPCTDALLHSYLLGLEGVTIVAHVHPIEINQITCSPRARQFADRRTVPHEIPSCGPASLLVPYADPGLPLAKEVRRKMVLWRDRYKVVPKLVLIQNFGLFVLGATREEILTTTNMAIKAAEIFIGASLLGGPVFLTPNNVLQIETMKEL